MPRNGSGIFSLATGYRAETGDLILADQHNLPLEDIKDDLNAARPIVAGGTGATTASAARTNLNVYSKTQSDAAYPARVATVTALQALDTATFTVVYVAEKLKIYGWAEGDYSDDIDGEDYISADGIDPSLGAWVFVTGGSGDMRVSEYDPQGVHEDAFSQDSMVDGTTNKNYPATDKAKVDHLTVTADIDLDDAVLNTATDASGFGFVVDEDDMASDSATKVSTQQSINAAKLQKVATRTALKALSGTTHPVIELYEAGREGQFKWDSSDLSAQVTVDTQEGIYIAPTSDATGASGAWVRIHDGVGSVKWFGAKGDGTTEDKAAFRALSQAIQNGFFTKGYIPAGEYVCGFSNVTTDHFDINGVDEWDLEGAGRESTKIIQSGASARPFTIRNCDHIGIRGLHFLCTYTASATNNFELMNCNQATVEKCRFEGATFYGLGAYQDTITPLDGTLDDLTVRFNEFIDIGMFGFENFPKVKSNGLELHNNVFRNCGYNPLSLAGDPAATKPGQATENSRIYNNKVYGAAGAGGIWMGNYEDIECFDNELYDIEEVAISLGASSHVYPYTGQYRSAIIRNNTLVTTSGFARAAEMITLVADSNGASTMGPVIIQGNKIINDSWSVSIRSQTLASIPKLQIIDNIFDRNLSTAYDAINMNSASGGAPNTPLIKGNTLINRNTSITTCRFTISNCANPRIIANRFVNVGNNALNLASNTGTIIVEDNIIDGYNVANTSSVAAIAVTDSGSNTYYVRRNKVLTNLGNPKSILSGNNATPTYYLDGNTADSVSVNVVSNGTPTISSSGATPFMQFAKARFFYGTAAPTTGGVYVQGDICINTAPTASGTGAWVCTAGGSPGTWKTLWTVGA